MNFPALAWSPLPDVSGQLMAAGAYWTYLIIDDGENVILTRWHARPGPSSYEIAGQAAANAITMPGAYGLFPEVAASVVRRLREAAEKYEAGQGLRGHRAWCYDPERKTA